MSAKWLSAFPRFCGRYHHQNMIAISIDIDVAINFKNEFT